MACRGVGALGQVAALWPNQNSGFGLQELALHCRSSTSCIKGAASSTFREEEATAAAASVLSSARLQAGKLLADVACNVTILRNVAAMQTAAAGVVMLSDATMKAAILALAAEHHAMTLMATAQSCADAIKTSAHLEASSEAQAVLAAAHRDAAELVADATARATAIREAALAKAATQAEGMLSQEAAEAADLQQQVVAVAEAVLNSVQLDAAAIRMCTEQRIEDIRALHHQATMQTHAIQQDVIAKAMEVRQQAHKQAAADAEATQRQALAQAELVRQQALVDAETTRKAVDADAAAVLEQAAVAVEAARTQAVAEAEAILQQATQQADAVSSQALADAETSRQRAAAEAAHILAEAAAVRQQAEAEGEAILRQAAGDAHTTRLQVEADTAACPHQSTAEAAQVGATATDRAASGSTAHSQGGDTGASRTADAARPAEVVGRLGSESAAGSAGDSQRCRMLEQQLEQTTSRLAALTTLVQDQVQQQLKTECSSEVVNELLELHKLTALITPATSARRSAREALTASQQLQCFLGAALQEVSKVKKGARLSRASSASPSCLIASAGQATNKMRDSDSSASLGKYRSASERKANGKPRYSPSPEPPLVSSSHHLSARDFAEGPRRVEEPEPAAPRARGSPLWDSGQESRCSSSPDHSRGGTDSFSPWSVQGVYSSPGSYSRDSSMSDSTNPLLASQASTTDPHMHDGDCRLLLEEELEARLPAATAAAAYDLGIPAEWLPAGWTVDDLPEQCIELWLTAPEDFRKTMAAFSSESTFGAY